MHPKERPGVAPAQILKTSATTKTQKTKEFKGGRGDGSDHTSRLDAIRTGTAAFVSEFLDDGSKIANFCRELETERAKAFQAVDDELCRVFPSWDVINESAAFKVARRARRVQAGKVVNSAVLKRWGLTKPPKPLGQGLKSPTGAGKTSSVILALMSGARRHSIDFLVPTMDKGDELLVDLLSAGVVSDIERGLDAVDSGWMSRGIEEKELQPFHDRTKMCLQAPAVAIAAQAGVEVAKEFCASCPFAGRCGTHFQKRRLLKIRERNGVVVKTHARLAYNSSVGQAAIQIFDEDPGRNMVKVITIETWKFSEKYLKHLCGPEGRRYFAEIGIVGDRLLDAIKSGLPATVLDETRRQCCKTVVRTLRKVARLDRPKLNGEQDPLKIAEIISGASTDARVLAKIIEQVAIVAAKKIPLHSVNVEADSVICRHVRKFGMTRQASALYMSANLRSDRLSASVGRKVWLKVFEADRNVIVHHIRTMATTARFTGLRPNGDPYSSKAVEKAAYKRASLIEEAQRRIKPDARVLFVSNVKLEQAFVDDFPETWEPRHFGELEGLNTYQDFDAIVLVGQAWPPLRETERLAAAVALSKGKAITTIADWHAKHPDAVTDSDGFIPTEAGPWHPDVFVRSEVETLVSDAYDQAIGRLRAINSPLPKTVISTLR